MIRRSKRLKAVPLMPLPKVPTGITGFDEITYGGLPALGRTTLIRGGPGCGKTVFALQSLVSRARDRGEPGILVAFEENANQIVANAATLGWNIPALAAKQLFFLDASLSPEMVQSGDFDLPRQLNLLQALIAESGAKHIVFDGIDVQLRLLDNPLAERREFYRLRDWILRRGLTAIITQKVGADDDHSWQHYNFMQFMADCVINLGHQVVDGSSFRHVRVMKYRGSGFLGDEFPITITEAGVRVTNRGPVELEYAVTDERVSSGLPRAGCHACRRIPSRQQRPDLGCARNGKVDAGWALRCRRVYAGRAGDVRELRRGCDPDRAQPGVGGDPAEAASAVGPAQDLLDAHQGAEHRGSVRRTPASD